MEIETCFFETPQRTHTLSHKGVQCNNQTKIKVLVHREQITTSSALWRLKPAPLKLLIELAHYPTKVPNPTTKNLKDSLVSMYASGNSYN